MEPNTTPDSLSLSLLSSSPPDSDDAGVDDEIMPWVLSATDSYDDAIR